MLVGHHVEAGVGATSRFSASARQAPPTSIEYFEPEIVKLVKELSRALPRAEYQHYLERSLRSLVQVQRAGSAARTDRGGSE